MISNSCWGCGCSRFVVVSFVPLSLSELFRSEFESTVVVVDVDVATIFDVSPLLLVSPSIGGIGGGSAR